MTVNAAEGLDETEENAVGVRRTLDAGGAQKRVHSIGVRPVDVT